MVRCVAYIHELFMTLTFDLNVKIDIFTMDLSLGRCLFSLIKAYQLLAYVSITMRQHVVYINDLSMT